MTALDLIQVLAKHPEIQQLDFEDYWGNTIKEIKLNEYDIADVDEDARGKLYVRIQKIEEQ